MIGLSCRGFRCSDLNMNKSEEIRLKERKIVQHYQDNYKEGRIVGFHGVNLRYVKPRNSESPTALIILGGRAEFLEKYREVIFDLRSLGVAIYSYDHRGQGGSDRLLADQRKGHVDSFTDYVEDLRIFVEQVVDRNQCHQQIVVLAHSMGAPVATLFQRDNPGLFSALLFTAPMFGINSAPLSTPVAELVAALMVRSGQGKSYIFGRGPEIYSQQYDNNPLTSSQDRFIYNLRLLEENPQLALGSPSFKWLHESYRWTRKIRNLSLEDSNEAIPILLLQAEDERVVVNAAQQQFQRNNPSCYIRVIAGARHELLMEADIIRDKVLDIIKEFVSKHK